MCLNLQYPGQAIRRTTKELDATSVICVWLLARGERGTVLELEHLSAYHPHTAWDVKMFCATVVGVAERENIGDPQLQH